MKEILDSIFLNNMNSQVAVYSTVASVVIGAAMLLAGVYFKKEKKGWWGAVSLIGVVAIIINVIKLM